MLRDITLGQYYQTDSIIHRLDPRVKLMATIIYIISLFIMPSATGYVLALCFLAIVLATANSAFRIDIPRIKANEYIGDRKK